jgi:hypothetical protein
LSIQTAPIETRQIDTLKSNWKCGRLDVSRQLRGKSGARIYLVDIELDQFNGHAILKLSNVDLTGEWKRQERACELNSTFASSHFPQIIRHESFDGWSALLMKVAAEGLLFTDAFSSISNNSFRLLVAQSIADKLLREWNRSTTISSSTYTGGQLLRLWLGHRVGANSRLPDLITEIYDQSAETEGFLLDAKKYPNPFSYIDSDIGNSIVSRLRPIFGFSHGDLHGGNVLVREHPPTPSQFYVIDFDSFDESSPLLYDHAYFELSYLLNTRKNATIERWCTLLESLENLEETSLVSSSLKEADDYGHVWCVALMRSTVGMWREKTYPDRKEDFTKQLLLARVAAGLNYAQKSELSSGIALSLRLKEFAFLYAATNLRALLVLTKEVESITYTPVDRGATAPKVTSDSWRAIWETCESFNENKTVFVLIAGPILGAQSEYSRAALASISWSLVLDFDARSDEGGLLGSVRGPISKRRGFHLMLPEQTPEVTFSKGVCWLMADGWGQRPDSFKGTLPEWRRYVVPSVRLVSHVLKSEVAPKPVNVLILGEGIEGAKLRAICTTLEEALPNAYINVVTNSPNDHSFALISEEVGRVREFACSYSDFANGIRQMVGVAPDDTDVYIPFRDKKGGEISRLQIEPARLALFGESFDLVYDGASRDGAPIGEVTDFLHGNTITWRELDLGLAVPREVVGVLRERIITMTAKSRSVALTLEHTPGAGGTTVARSVAWLLRNTYPTVVLKRYTNTTAELLEWLGHASGLAVFVVIERRDLSDDERDRLFRDLKGRYVRFIFLDVRRALNPREDGISNFALRDPMTAREANYFFDRYSTWAPGAKAALRRLVADSALRELRSAFFFGFYSFEEKFTQIATFVSAHLAGLTATQREVIARLALITRYSQNRLPYSCLYLLADVIVPQSTPVADLAGPSKRLIVFSSSSLGIVHPKIAEEVLIQCLTFASTGSKTVWRSYLADACVNLIKALGRNPHDYGENIKDILIQLFVERSIWGNAHQPRLFSNLIETIPTKEGQRRVLETLCDTFPSNAHFWNHLGRHLNLRTKAPYGESERCFLRAIQLESENEMHHHGLGMVYRLEVEARLEPHLRPEERPLERLEAIDGIFELAEESFRVAYRLDPGSDYPLVTHIQIIVESIERLFTLLHEKRYEDLLNRGDGIGEWCRLKLQRAEALLTELRRNQAEGERSRYAVEFESRMLGLYGNFEAMVLGLTKLLNRDDVDKPSVRRLIAHCHIRHNREDFDHIEKRTVRRIAEMMLENISVNPGNDSDINCGCARFGCSPNLQSRKRLSVLRIGRSTQTLLMRHTTCTCCITCTLLAAHTLAKMR